MSTPQPTHARTTLVVDRETADVLRVEVKKVAMFEHDLFEDFLDYSPGAQYGLSLRYRDVFDALNAVCWDPEKVDPAATTFEVPLTDDLISLLGLRHHDLLRTNVDRLGEIEANEPIPADVLAEVVATRSAAQKLDGLFAAYGRATRD